MSSLTVNTARCFCCGCDKITNNEDEKYFGLRNMGDGTGVLSYC